MVDYVGICDNIAYEAYELNLSEDWDYANESAIGDGLKAIGRKIKELWERLINAITNFIKTHFSGNTLNNTYHAPGVRIARDYMKRVIEMLQSYMKQNLDYVTELSPSITVDEFEEGRTRIIRALISQPTEYVEGLQIPELDQVLQISKALEKKLTAAMRKLVEGTPESNIMIPKLNSITQYTATLTTKCLMLVNMCKQSNRDEALNVKVSNVQATIQ